LTIIQSNYQGQTNGKEVILWLVLANPAAAIAGRTKSAPTLSPTLPQNSAPTHPAKRRKTKSKIAYKKPRLDAVFCVSPIPAATD
jgi:hypothetical protein